MMNLPQTHRRVRLLDGNRDVVDANLYRGLPGHVLDEIELNWSRAREAAARERDVNGMNPLEHDHWNWRNKAESVEDGRHLLVAVECAEEWQGVMAAARLPRSGRLGGGPVVYVDYIETAPWNLRQSATEPRLRGVGLALMVDAVRLSVESGFGGVGLHSLTQAEWFYTRCGLTRVGEDPDYYGLPYYEITASLAIAWLESLGELT